MNRVLSLSCFAVFFLVSCFQSDPDERKKELIDFCGKSIDEVAGVMDDRGWVETEKEKILFYAETKKEDNDEQDYYQFHLNTPGKFVVAMKDPEEFENFFAFIDSSRIECPSCKGCKSGSAYYQISPECYVCKEGFSRKGKRRILRVSRDGNFEFLKETPKSETSHKLVEKNKPEPSPKKLPHISQEQEAELQRKLYNEQLQRSVDSFKSKNPDGKTAKKNTSEKSLKKKEEETEERYN